MHNKLLNTNAESVVFLEILFTENKDIDSDSQRHKVYASKHEEPIENPQNNPLFNKVAAISLSYIKGDECRMKTLQGEQKEVLKEFAKMMTSKAFGGKTLCMWNGAAYKIPFLRWKFIEEGMAEVFSKFRFNDAFIKAWMVAKDMIDLIEGTGGAGYRSLGFEETCALINLPMQNLNADITEKDSEEVKDIIEERLKNIVLMFLNLKGEDRDLSFDSVPSKDLEELPLIQRLAAEETISKKHAKEIREILEGRPKSEQKGIIDIMKGVLVKKGNLKAGRKELKKIDKIFQELN